MNDKAIIKKLYKIAQNQQKIINKLAQVAPTEANPGSDFNKLALKNAIVDSLKSALKISDLPEQSVTMSMNDASRTIGVGIKAPEVDQTMDYIRAACREAVKAVAGDPNTDGWYVGQVILNGVNC